MTKRTTVEQVQQIIVGSTIDSPQLLNQVLLLLSLVPSVDTNNAKNGDSSVSFWGIPAIIYGKPGAGKTSFIQAFASSIGFESFPLIGSSLSPEDIRGLPIITTTNSGQKTTTFAVPDFALNASEAKKSIVFADEFNASTGALQNAIMQLVLERKAGDFKMDKEVRIFCAANFSEHNSSVNDLLMPLANRLGHYTFDVPNTVYGEYFLGSSQTNSKYFLLSLEEVNRVRAELLRELESSKSSEEELINSNKKFSELFDAKLKEMNTAIFNQLQAKIEQNWEENRIRGRSAVGNYLMAHPSATFNIPNPSTPEASSSWASPRTWEMAANIYSVFCVVNEHLNFIKNTDKVNYLGEDVLNIALNGVVGIEAARTFRQYVKYSELPSPKELLALKTKDQIFERFSKLNMGLNDVRLDQRDAIASSVLSYIHADKTILQALKAEKEELRIQSLKFPMKDQRYENLVNMVEVDTRFPITRLLFVICTGLRGEFGRGKEANDFNIKITQMYMTNGLLSPQLGIGYMGKNSALSNTFKNAEALHKEHLRGK